MNSGKSDTIYAAWEEKRITWYGNKDDLEILGGKSWIIKKHDNSDNIITSLSGYLLLLKPSQIRSKSLFSSITEAYVINDPMAVVTIHNEKELIKVIDLFQNSLETEHS
tara:strand:- start:664 stop:990 length:327 start_codon:yes stop_codon:yes gene_type:complete